MIAGYKQEGESMGELLLRLRKEHKIAPSIPMTYAGRLDPMAEGEVLILVGEECATASTHWYHPKRYDAEILFGIATDTADALGIVRNVQPQKIRDLAPVLKEFTGKFEIPYPAYSSRPVDGKPLWQWTREGKKPPVWPTSKCEVFDIEAGERSIVKVKDIARKALGRIAKVNGDFRQNEIALMWKQVSDAHGNEEVTLVPISFYVSGGTYIRSLAEQIGKKIGVPAMAWRIVRREIER